ncbi:spore gernimation protein GerA [Paenibacillus sp. FSL R7-0273]|uniref:spore germination protein n=1 Tax=Paenibacillus sp. FSL R7-0273 TaxID=1536772 RepID=UPI0004F5EE76|nr:spore germination protein [Paenibacillus sp. FSL R7-0273]AIQ45168.1 spore gernimation protein GerA [Paenibacillus sp. FSL R7-0273]OMF85687.1 spore germination protein [Paenibacillus sp. FSL R7-0273]
MLATIISYIPGWAIFGQAGIALLFPLAGHGLYKALYSLVGSGRAVESPGTKNSDPNKGLQAAADTGAAPSPRCFSGDYASDLKFIKDSIGSNSDLHFKEFTISGLQKQAVLIFVDGMQNDRQLNLEIMQYLMSETATDSLSDPEKALSELPFIHLTEASDLTMFNQSVLFGHAGLLVEGMPRVLLIEPPDSIDRTLGEPVSEALLRGPRLGFSEVLSENTSILRRQGLCDQLEMRSYQAGSRIRRDIVLAYMKDIVNPEVLKEVETRISKLDIDFLAESGYIEQLIEDNYLSPFQQVQNTERPDRVISALLEGRIAILLDGTPFALIVPVTFSMLLQSPEDYYERWLPGSMIRLLRFAASFMALMAPALYISFISFHPGLIPTELALSIIETRQGVPFPSIIEVLILEISIEILREAGIRLPKPVGPAMGIVGGLIIGDAAVNAGIVSPFLVIVVAVTAISSFSIPMYSAGLTLRMLRFVGMGFAALLGMFGTILFFLLLCSHLTKLKSFGVPYLTPVTPYRLADWKDLFLRAPLSLMKRRPIMMKTQNNRRKS